MKRIKGDTITETLKENPKRNRLCGKTIKWWQDIVHVGLRTLGVDGWRDII